MGQAVAVEVVNVAESLPTCLAGVVLPHRVWVGICRSLRQNRQAGEHTKELRWKVELQLYAQKEKTFVETMQMHTYFCLIWTKI